ncbi:MAG: hypothetical protein CEN90_31 [Parcubacteria group bacterium Licking1014_17]|nr:MAG: hypothetical protein CEN90_31 [Parcubacteria group bacterium Licking1014_17]
MAKVLEVWSFEPEEMGISPGAGTFLKEKVVKDLVMELALRTLTEKPLQGFRRTCCLCPECKEGLLLLKPNEITPRFKPDEANNPYVNVEIKRTVAYNFTFECGHCKASFVGNFPIPGR